MYGRYNYLSHKRLRAPSHFVRNKFTYPAFKRQIQNHHKGFERRFSRRNASMYKAGIKRSKFAGVHSQIRGRKWKLKGKTSSFKRRRFN